MYRINFEIYRKLPFNILEMVTRTFNQPKYSRSLSTEFSYPFRFYATKDGNLVISNYNFKKNQKVGFLGNRLKRYLRYIGYLRKSNDFKNQLFAHNFNGTEKIYTCNFKNYIIYYIAGTKDLWEEVIE